MPLTKFYFSFKFKRFLVFGLLTIGIILFFVFLLRTGFWGGLL